MEDGFNVTLSAGYGAAFVLEEIPCELIQQRYTDRRLALFITPLRSGLLPPSARDGTVDKRQCDLSKSGLVAG